MDSDSISFLIIAALLALVVRIAAGWLDAGRIEEYFYDKGWQLLKKQWVLFGPGWLHSRGRIYRIRYIDHESNIREAMCKTHLGAGVYFTEDRVVHRVVHHPPEEGTNETDRVIDKLVRPPDET